MEPRTSTSTFTQLLSSDKDVFLFVFSFQCCFTSTETTWLIRDGGGGGGEKGERGYGGGGREILYLSLHCLHHNDSCIKMGSDEIRFNVSLIVKDKVTRQCPVLVWRLNCEQQKCPE